MSSVSFSPSPTSSLLASVSWDKTLRLWDAVTSAASVTRETINLTADGLYVCFRPDGKQLAAATLDGHISIFDPIQACQLSTIEGAFLIVGLKVNLFISFSLQAGMIWAVVGLTRIW